MREWGSDKLRLNCSHPATPLRARMEKGIPIQRKRMDTATKTALNSLFDYLVDEMAAYVPLPDVHRLVNGALDGFDLTQIEVRKWQFSSEILLEHTDRTSPSLRGEGLEGRWPPRRKFLYGGRKSYGEILMKRGDSGGLPFCQRRACDRI